MESAASRQWRSDPPETGSVEVSISYYFVEDTLGVDNIPKPILDALNGLVFLDDQQVTDLCCHKRDVKISRRISDLPPPLVRYVGGATSVLHVSIAQAPD